MLGTNQSTFSLIRNQQEADLQLWFGPFVFICSSHAEDVVLCVTKFKLWALCLCSLSRFSFTAGSCWQAQGVCILLFLSLGPDLTWPFHPSALLCFLTFPAVSIGLASNSEQSIVKPELSAIQRIFINEVVV